MNYKTPLALLLVLTFLIGADYLSAWVAPAAVPPASNVTAPLNTSSAAQIKSGGVGVGAIDVAGGAIVRGTSNLTDVDLTITGRVGAAEYCDINGQNCFTAGTVGGGTSGWGTWTNVTASRPTGVWHRNTNTQGIMVFYYISRSDVVAYVSPTGTTADQVQITGVDGDSGERTHSNFIVPPGHYYRFNGGTMSIVAELRLPF